MGHISYPWEIFTNNKPQISEVWEKIYLIILFWTKINLPLIKIWASKGSSTWSILIGIFHSNVGKNWHVFFSSYLHSGVEVCFWSIFNEFSQVFFCLAHLGKSAPTCVAYEYVYDFLDTQEQSEQRLFPKRQVFFTNTENAY